MKIICTLMLFWALILNSIVLSLQSKRLPDDGPNPGFHQCGPSSSTPRRHCPDTTHSLDSPHYPSRSSRPAEPPLRDRCRSPTLKQTFPGILGYRFEDLAFIRLIPKDYPHRIFELLRYVFPPGKPIGLRTTNHTLNPMPTKEHIVLSTSNGDAYAVLDKSNKRIVLRGIFTSVSGQLKRAKINMNNGAVEELTAEEIAECPVTTQEPITNSYGVLCLSSQSKGLPDDDPDPDSHRCGPSSSSPGRHFPDTTQSSSGSAVPADPSLRIRFRIPVLQPTFSSLLGYKLEDLEFIRLIPNNSPNRIFELRRYVFPPDQPIGLRTRNHVLNPMPTGEQIVLSTSNGDVCAILDKSGRHTILRPIFTRMFGISGRVKININTGAVEGLTKQEIAECPVTSREQITKSYSVLRAQTTSLSHR